MFLFQISSLLLLLATVSLKYLTPNQLSSIQQTFLAFSEKESKSCQFRFPIKTTQDFSAFFHWSCNAQRGDSFCDDGYESMFQIQELHIDESHTCVHLTDNNVGKEFDDYQLVDNGIVMIYNIPHPEDFPDHCVQGDKLQFKIHYHCNPEQNLITKIAIFDQDKLSCTPELFIDSKQICQYLPKKNRAQEIDDVIVNSSTCHSARRKVQNAPNGWLAEIESVKGYCMAGDLHHIDQRCHDDYKSILTLQVTPPLSKMKCIHLTDDDPNNIGSPQPLDQNKGFKVTYKVPSTSPFPERCGDQVDFTIFYVCNPNLFQKDDGGSFFNGKELKCHPYWKIQSKFFCKQMQINEPYMKSKVSTGLIDFQQTQEILAEDEYQYYELPQNEPQKQQKNPQTPSSNTSQYNKVWEYINNYNWFFTIVMVILGAFYVIFGLKMFKITIFLFAMVTIVALFLLVSFGFIISDGAEKWVGWVILGIGIVIGVLAGLCLLKCIRIGIFLLGGWPGAICGLLLYNLFLHYIAGNVLLWIVVGAMFIAGGVIALCLEDHAIIIGTSVLGSYLFVRGLSLVIGKYPNQFTVYDEIERGIVSSFSWQFILYLVAMAVIAVFGIIYQEKKLRDEDDDEKEKRHNYVKLGKSN